MADRGAGNPGRGLLMPRHFRYAGTAGEIGDCLEQVGSGMYSLCGHPCYFPESCLELAEPRKAVRD
ncbi:hypothetical protein FACS189493_1510 [Spirochaetia bacterium]|nr:hypothetical protein FACS189493_1510 [Spirochaetia bacterium]